MKYFNYLLILILVLSYFVCVQHNEIETLNSKVNALDYKTDNIKKKDFPTVEPDYKETFYLSQLSNSTTLVLSVIGFALVIAGIFSFSVIDNKFKVFNSVVQSDFQGLVRKFNTHKTSVDTSIEKMTIDITKYGENYKMYESRHNDFEFRLTNFQANESINRFFYNYDKNDFEMALYYALNALSDFSKCYFIENKFNDAGFKDGVFESMNSTLDLLNNQKSFIMSVQFKKVIYNSMIIIRNIDDENIHKKLSLLDSKITYENNKRF